MKRTIEYKTKEEYEYEDGFSSPNYIVISFVTDDEKSFDTMRDGLQDAMMDAANQYLKSVAATDVMVTPF